jgi:hypothetical protein
MSMTGTDSDAMRLFSQFTADRAALIAGNSIAMQQIRIELQPWIPDERRGAVSDDPPFIASVPPYGRA